MTIIDVSKLVEGPVQEDNPFQVNQHHFSSDAQLENFLLSSQYFWSLMVQRIEDDLCRHLLLMLCWESRKISYKVGCTLKGLSFYFHVVQLNFQENKRERERERDREDIGFAGAGERCIFSMLTLNCIPHYNVKVLSFLIQRLDVRASSEHVSIYKALFLLLAQLNDSLQISRIKIVFPVCFITLD